MSAGELPNEKDDLLTEQEARLLVANGLGKVELEFLTSLCAPLYWSIRTPQGRVCSHNGVDFR